MLSCRPGFNSSFYQRYSQLKLHALLSPGVFDLHTECRSSQRTFMLVNAYLKCLFFVLFLGLLCFHFTVDVQLPSKLGNFCCYITCIIVI